MEWLKRDAVVRDDKRISIGGCQLPRFCQRKHILNIAFYIGERLSRKELLRQVFIKERFL
jgi:hypothetical protein